MPTPTLNVEEYQFTDTGVKLNTTAAVPFVDIEEVQGLDSGTLRTQTKDHEGVDGGFVDSYYETLRTVVVSGTIYVDPTQYETYMETLKANFAPTQTAMPFYFMTDAGMRVVYGKSQGLKYTKTNKRSYGTQPFNFTILCEDPRVYDPTQTSIQIVLQGALTGRGYPKGYPFGYGPVVTPNSGTLVLTGTRSTPGSYFIKGPITNPSIINDTLGLRWDFNITLGADDTLVIDPQYKTVRLGLKGPSRRINMTGPWWMLQPGNNDFRLQGSNGVNGLTSLTINALPARR